MSDQERGDIAGRCSNCGAEAKGRFCPECGQATRSPRGPLRQLVSDLLDSIFSLDSRAVHSLPALCLRPGQLTRDFLEGKRASRVRPVRFYLVTSLIFFFLFQHPSPDLTTTEVWIGDEIVQEVPRENRKGIVKLMQTEDTTFGHRIAPMVRAKREEALAKMSPQMLVDRIFEAVEDAIPTALIFFLPLLAILLKLFFLGSGRLYFDHLIFALHFQSFLFIVLTLVYLLRPTMLFPFAAGVAGLFVPIYFARAAREVYGDPWWKIVPKTAVMAVAYLVLALAVYANVMFLALMRV